MGPLEGVKVVEMAGIGAAPFAAMMLADVGADVVRVDRPAPAAGDPAAGDPAAPGDPALDVLNRGRRSVVVDLKHPRGVDTALKLVEAADVLIEGFRPGVMERLGLGPTECGERNPRLVYGRMTGWGQGGPLARTAGHDIDYIAVAGVLGSIARSGQTPVPPLNLVGDFGGGGLLLAFGVVCAVLEARRSGHGQVVDAAMVDGAALLLAMHHGLMAMGVWHDLPGTNVLDTGAHFYDVYETADARYVAVGAIEPRFYAELLRGLGLDAGDLPEQFDRSRWPELKERLAEVFRTRTRAEWVAVFEGSDACVAPVLSMREAPAHPHNAARGNFVRQDGVLQPAPAPRFSRTPSAIAGPPPTPGRHTREVLAGAGLTGVEIEELERVGAVR